MKITALCLTTFSKVCNFLKRLQLTSKGFRTSTSLSSLSAKIAVKNKQQKIAFMERETINLKDQGEHYLCKEHLVK